MPALILLTEDSPRQVFQLGRATLMVGRDDSSAIRVSDDSVSRNHASIIFENKEYVVHDNGSTNGTYVNGVCVSRHVLRHHDILRFGTCLFLFDTKETLKGPRGTEVISVTHVASRKGEVCEIAPKPLIPGSPITPVKVILSTNVPIKKNKPLPPMSAR